MNYIDNVPLIPSPANLASLLADGGKMLIADENGPVEGANTFDVEAADFAVGRRVVYLNYAEFAAIDRDPMAMVSHVIFQLNDGTDVVAVPNFVARMGGDLRTCQIPQCAIYFDQEA